MHAEHTLETPRTPAPLPAAADGERITLQKQLMIGAVDDPLEAEADAMAEQVMRMPEPSPNIAPTATTAPGLQRKCSGCAEDDERAIQRKPLSASITPFIQTKHAEAGATRDSAERASVPFVHDVLRSPGEWLDSSARDFFQERFGHDFSHVRVHRDAQAADSAQALNARAYTVGRDIVFGAGQYAPSTTAGQHLLAHELTHVIQQGHGRSHEAVQRACLPAASCAAPAGSASVFVSSVISAEAAARARRGRMSPARQIATGHTGHARQLEKFLEDQSPGLLPNIHGIFIDQDMDPRVAASTQSCASMVPPILGATKLCVFVPGHKNQEALKFNTDPAATTIGGRSRENWRIDTLQTLIHEIEHVRYDVAMGGAAVPAGVTCPRADVLSELSELDAIMSEFPTVFDAVPAGATATDPAKVRLDNWFNRSITNPSESIRGTLKAIDCKCDCADTDKYVKETFAFVSSSWSAAQKTAFNTELKRAIWSLRWPL